MTRMQPRISLITLGVRDLARATAFYESLGLVRDDGTDGVVAFDLLGQTLGLFDLDKLARDMGLPVDALGFGGATLGHNLDSRAEVDAMMQLAEKAGARILKAPQEVFWGGYHGYFADPDGHIWEIAHNPFAPLRQGDGAFRWQGYPKE